MTRLQVTGMTCAACVRRVERALSKVEGVESAQVNFATHQAVVMHAPYVGVSTLLVALERAGYPASEVGDVPVDESNPVWRAVLAGALAIPVIALSMASHHRSLAMNIGLTLASAVVTFGPGWPILSQAAHALKRRTFTMDTLIALGSLSSLALAFGAIAAFHADPMRLSHAIYSESAASIIFLVLVGRSLEHRASRHMRASYSDLMSIAPAQACVVLSGVETTVAVSELKIGAIVRVRPGERIAADGIVVAGASRVDESMLTGEPNLVAKAVGDAVVCGSLNDSGTLDLEVSRGSGDTKLSQIARLVQEAQGSKAPIQHLADRVTAVFVPVVIALAVVAAIVHAITGSEAARAIMIGVSVLVIACPCALGLATPTAVVVGLGRAARSGLIFKSAAAIQRLAEVKIIALDKTGTLTEGRPTVVAVEDLAGWSREEALAFSAALEGRSLHPLGRAVTDASPGPYPEVTDFVEVRGQGIAGSVQGVAGRVGRAEFCGESSEAEGFWVGSGERQARIVVRDPLRAGASIAIGQLGQLGMNPVLLTGDQRANAEAVAGDLGIREVHPGLLPEEKLAKIEELMRRGLVAMVGDGINDGPALAKASVGIALSSGTDFAQHSADVTLVNNDLAAVAQAVRIARATQRTIRTNLALAFGYNVLMIPIAMLGMLSPMMASAAMACSSITVVLNSLWLGIRRVS